MWAGSVLFLGRGCAEHGQHPCLCTVPNPALSLRRLERLQRIVSKLQMESGLCEEQLNQADTLLQSVRGGCGSVWGGRARCGAVQQRPDRVPSPGHSAAERGEGAAEGG